jgi:hypothetical protein
MLDFSRTRFDRKRPLSSYTKVRRLMTLLIRKRQSLTRASPAG